MKTFDSIFENAVLGKSIEIMLDYPPSVNHYYYHARDGHFITDAGKNFLSNTCIKVFNAMRQNGIDTFMGKVLLLVELYMPDNRKRDADNILKQLLDGLTHQKLFNDDSQVYTLIVKKIEKRKHEYNKGMCKVICTEENEK